MMTTEPISEIEPTILQFVPFEIALGSKKLWVALNVQKVKEIIEFKNLSQVPHTLGYTLGIYDLKGCPVPVLDINSILFKSESNPSEFSRIVVLELQDLWLGLPVTKTGRMIHCANIDFIPPPPGSKMENIGIVTGLIRREGQFIPILNIENIAYAGGFISELKESFETREQAFPGKRILIVEDSRVTTKHLQRIFHKWGCTTESAADGAQALALLERHPNSFDLIFTDIEMPVMDGISFARQLKQNPQYASIPVLFNSSLSNPALIAELENEKLGHFLVKLDEELIYRNLESLFSGFSTSQVPKAVAAA